MVVYKLTNTVNGKAYIGITTRAPSDRLADHLLASRSDRQVLYRAMRKHGAAKFRLEVIATAGTLDALMAIERRLIAEYGTHTSRGGYNMTLGGEGTFGLKHSPDYVARMAARCRGKPLSPEHRAKLSAAQKGRKKPPGFAAKVSASQKGRVKPVAERENISRAQRRRMATLGVSTKTRAKLSAALIGRKKSAAHREKLRAILARARAVYAGRRASSKQC